MTNDPCFMTAVEAGALLKARKLSPVELVRAFLERIERLDPLIRAYIRVTAEQALAEAKAAEAEIAAGRYRGPLHGIPYALKDIIDYAGVPTTANSRLLMDNVPATDSTVVAGLKRAGAVCLGKTAMREFATGTRHDDLPWPYPLNPWNRAHEFAGGSSTGSAAAVGAGLAMVALGTDTGGSIRNPSGFCGLAGMKPTYGRVSRTGVVPNTFTFDSVGPMTWTVADCALVLQAISGFDADDPGGAREPVPDFSRDLDKGVRGFRIGVIRNFYEDALPADHVMRRAFEEALDVLGGLGARFEDLRLRSIDDYNTCRTLISGADHYAIHEKDLRERPHLYGPKLAKRMPAGMMISAVDYIQAQRERLKMAREMADAFRPFDAVLTLTTLETAPLNDPAEAKGAFADPSLTRPFNVSGQPAMTVCTGFDERGLPLAMQIAGKAFDEATVLRVGQAYERATDWKSRRPALEEKAAA